MVYQNGERKIIEDPKQERNLGIIINHKLKWKEKIADCKKSLCIARSAKTAI